MGGASIKLALGSTGWVGRTQRSARTVRSRRRTWSPAGGAGAACSNAAGPCRGADQCSGRGIRLPLRTGLGGASWRRR